MFEAEIEMEKKESSIIPLLLVLVLAGLILSGVGGVVWMVVQTKKGLPEQDVAAIISRQLQEEGPAKTHFYTGLVKQSAGEKVLDPHYKLLEKVGIIDFKLQKDKYSAKVTLTPEGEKKMTALSAKVTPPENKDGDTQYVVPLAERKLVAITQIKMDGPNRAYIEYTWKWEPNELGKSFDASGSVVKGFGTYERMALIDKYGAAFYNADPAKHTVLIVKKDKGWEVAQ
jgi:hypothetical protein